MTKRIALLWYGDDLETIGGKSRLKPLYDALVGQGVDVVSIAYTHDRHDSVAEQLEGCHGIIVWMNPIEDGKNRSHLDALLTELANQDVIVSARPDIIQKMGTKAVIYHTRELEWGTDSFLYDTWGEFAETFPNRLANLGTRVLKQGRGSSGDGVYKVELLSMDAILLMNAGDDATTETSITSFIDSWREHFSAGGYLVEQPYLPRVGEGMIRCYMNQNRVIGILHQLPKSGGMNVSQSRMFVTDGLPEGTAVYDADTERYAPLKAKLEHEWVDAMCQAVDMDMQSLPVLWDIDFIMGEKNADGEDSYLLCEINVSSVYPPSNAPFDQLAETLIRLL